jgi:hypothetical protein
MRSPARNCVTLTEKLPAPSTPPVPINTSLALPQASPPQSKMLMQVFGLGFAIAVPVTMVEPATAPPVMAGATSGVGVRVNVAVAVGVVVAVLVVVPVGVIVGDCVAVGGGVLVPVGVAVLVVVLVGEIVAVRVTVPVGVMVEVGCGVLVTVAVGVMVGEFVAVPVCVAVAVAVLVPVGVAVGVFVDVGVGVGVRPTTIFPVPRIHGTGVSIAPTRIDRAQPVVGICNGLLPLACPSNVMLTMLIGGLGATAGRHAHEQFTAPIGGVGAGVLHKGKQPVNGG